MVFWDTLFFVSVNDDKSSQEYKDEPSKTSDYLDSLQHELTSTLVAHTGMSNELSGLDWQVNSSEPFYLNQSGENKAS